MGMIESRRRVMAAQGGGTPPTPTPTYDGIPVYQDNCRFTTGSGKLTDIVESEDWFLTGVFDSGNENQKSYELTRFGYSVDVPIRFFNDLTASNRDYWTIWRSDITTGNIYNFGSPGRYIVIPILKSKAADFYMKDANGNYIVKGNNVI